MNLTISALRKGLKISIIIGIIATVAGLCLPNLAAVREKARRVNDLENLNAIWKVISQWGMTVSNLDQLVKSKLITPDMLINHETGKPIEYYPASSDEGDHVVLVSRGKHGAAVVKAAGQGMWVDDGTPHDADSAGDRQIRWNIGIGLLTVLLAGLWWILGRLKTPNQVAGRD